MKLACADARGILPRMKTPRFTRALVALTVLAAAVHVVAQENKTLPAPAAPAFEMTTYYFVMLMKGPASGTGTKEEAAAAQAGHMAHMKKMADAGKLLVAGPFAAGAASEWRGIWIMKCASIEEATELASGDPAVQAGRLTIKVLPWMTAKGYIRDPEFPFAPLP